MEYSDLTGRGVQRGQIGNDYLHVEELLQPLGLAGNDHPDQRRWRIRRHSVDVDLADHRVTTGGEGNRSAPARGARLGGTVTVDGGGAPHHPAAGQIAGDGDVHTLALGRGEGQIDIKGVDVLVGRITGIDPVGLDGRDTQRSRRGRCLGPPGQRLGRWWPHQSRPLRRQSGSWARTLARRRKRCRYRRAGRWCRWGSRWRRRLRG